MKRYICQHPRNQIPKQEELDYKEEVHTYYIVRQVSFKKAGLIQWAMVGVAFGKPVCNMRLQIHAQKHISR